MASIDDTISTNGEERIVWLLRSAPVTTTRIRIYITKMGLTPYLDYELPAVREFEILPQSGSGSANGARGN
jgi:hypothetical protein